MRTIIYLFIYAYFTSTIAWAVLPKITPHSHSNATSNISLQYEVAPSTMTKNKDVKMKKLSDYQWRNRLLLVALPTNNSCLVDTQNNTNIQKLAKSFKHDSCLKVLISQFNQHLPALAERKLVIFIQYRSAIYLLDTSGMTSHASEKEHLTASNLQAVKYLKSEFDRLIRTKYSVLVGLDGGVKSFYSIEEGKLDLKRVFADIDGMPMRRAELNN